MKKQRSIELILVAIIALSSNSLAFYWVSNVDTNSNHWSIYRESSNLSFDLSGSVEGVISPVKFHNRILSPYQSYYEEVAYNDVRLRQRTAALEGNYKSSAEMTLRSKVYPDDIEIHVDKPSGIDRYTIEYKYEQWPVIIKASRAISYSGLQINDRDFEGNNGDFVGANFFYNHELSKEQTSVIWLQRMNASVLATDDAILSAEFKPTKYLGYLIRANSTGISDLSYRLRSSQYDVKHQCYPVLSQGEERYYGTYELARKIELRSIFENSNDTNDEYFDAYYAANNWLPCCSDGVFNMPSVDQKTLELVKGVFDCTCNTMAAKAQFRK